MDQKISYIKIYLIIYTRYKSKNKIHKNNKNKNGVHPHNAWNKTS